MGWKERKKEGRKEGRDKEGGMRAREKCFFFAEAASGRGPLPSCLPLIPE